MTRFQREISGDLGTYWQQDATMRVHDYVEEAKVETEVDSNGAIRWKTNGNYLMDDYCEILEYAGMGKKRSKHSLRKGKESFVR